MWLSRHFDRMCGTASYLQSVLGAFFGPDITPVVAWTVLAWSLASHLAAGTSRAHALADGGVPSRELSHEELEEFLPMEPLYDLFLPLLGVGVAALPRWTLGLSLLEPLLLLTLPGTRGSLRRVHDRLLAWHLGGIFAHPMLIAEVVVIRQGRDDVSKVAFLGALVGIYAFGAAAGSYLRLALLNYLPPGPRMVMRVVLVCIIVVASVIGLLAYGNRLDANHGHGHGHHGDASAESASERSPLLGEGASASQSAKSALRKCGRGDFRADIRQVLAELPVLAKQMTLPRCCDELVEVMMAAYTCRFLLAARALTMLSLALLLGSATLPPVDLFGWTALEHGFSVSWFDIVSVLSSSVLVPLCGEASLVPGFAAAAAACAIAVLAALRAASTAFELAMIAGCALSACTAAANAVLPVRMARSVERPGQLGPALGWGLLAGGLGQVIGLRLGPLLFVRSSWLGVTSSALLACLAGWYCSTEAPVPRA
eukprot:TRINITY_DN21317_c0_g1_i1.p1 TRINITY_DN21317_c0_g1~~TRINITY_DN21317_c0_g1_i1.p1  ORF type:complete len:484 (-),score=103.50 TRINITY_DN21317_c0_g1_i1:95-1546(-)